MFYALACKPEQLLEYATLYDYSMQELDLAQYAPEIQERGFLTRSDLQRVASWKAPRSAGHISKNSEKYVQAVTAIAFHTDNERLRIESLTLLDGVGWPTASVILHFYHPDRYPILDSRALSSLSLEVPKQYTFTFWWDYTAICRSIATDLNLDMRTLDKALWMYGKDQQSEE